MPVWETATTGFEFKTAGSLWRSLRAVDHLLYWRVCINRQNVHTWKWSHCISKTSNRPSQKKR